MASTMAQRLGLHDGPATAAASSPAAAAGQQRAPGADEPALWHAAGSGKDIAKRNREGKEEIMQKLPRYVRINTLKCTFGEAKRELKATGHILEIEPRVRNKNAWRRQKPDKKQNGRGYKRDPDVKELLVFHGKGKSDLSRVPLVQSGALIVQQKASCFPGLALAPPPGTDVIDACAAPGSKTTHLAALMQNKGVLFAFDRSDQRLGNLRKLVATRGATNIRASDACRTQLEKFRAFKPFRLFNPTFAVVLTRVFCVFASEQVRFTLTS